jgi:hypothetical protein
MPLDSPYAAQIADELSTIRDRVGLKVSQLWRNNHQVFGAPTQPPDHQVRLYVLLHIAVFVASGPLPVEDRKDAACKTVAAAMYWNHVIEEHFSDESMALYILIARVLASPKRKYWRHAMRLPRYATPALYQAAVRESLLAYFVLWPEEAGDVEEEIP